MSIKSILVVVSGMPGDDARLRQAFALARRSEAAVVVLHVMPSPVLYVGGPEFGMPSSVIEGMQRQVEATAKAAEAAARAEAERAGMAIEWRCEEGEEPAVAAEHARYADLVIASPDLTRDLVFVAGGPVLAFAKDLTPKVPARILIAWNGGREAARAVRDAMPLLEMAKAVDVVVVDPPADRPIGPDLARSLARHGIKVEVRELPSGGTEAGVVLLDEARRSGADLLVMGAYGHSRLREWVLGGATEEALETAGVALLLAH